MKTRTRGRGGTGTHNLTTPRQESTKRESKRPKGPTGGSSYSRQLLGHKQEDQVLGGSVLVEWCGFFRGRYTGRPDVHAVQVSTR